MVGLLFTFAQSGHIGCNFVFVSCGRKDLARCIQIDEEDAQPDKQIRPWREDGRRYAIQFQQPVRARETAIGILRVTQADGSGFNRLEPVMGAFAHLVGFHENQAHVLHVHPEASQSPAAEDRGGPELHFRLYATLPGFFRLFVQVQRDGAPQFASFGLNVLPRNTPQTDEEAPHVD
jgi:hypothetical protein